MRKSTLVLTLATVTSVLAQSPSSYRVTHTYLQALVRGDAVNLEADILAKYVERLIEVLRAPAPSRLTAERLIEEGF